MHLISFKNVIRSLIAGVALAVIASAPTAQAGFVVGSDTFGFDNVVANNANLKLATSFTISDITTAIPSTGDFTVVPSGTLVEVGPVTLNPSTPLFTWTSAAFGTFMATSLVDDSSSGTGKSRSIEFAGTFSGGTLFPGKHGASLADLVISFTQSGNPHVGKPVSGSFTLTTVAPIPEPTSVAMLGLGLCGLISFRRFRRKSA